MCAHCEFEPDPIEQEQQRAMRLTLNQLYWAPHSTLAFVIAELIENDADSATLQSIDGERITMKASKAKTLKAAHRTHSVDCDDLQDLHEMNECIILHHLRERFNGQRTYTQIGNALISVNPNERVDDKGDGDGPHIDRLTANCHSKLLSTKRSQSILIWGPSDSGKMWRLNVVIFIVLSW